MARRVLLPHRRPGLAPRSGRLGPRRDSRGPAARSIIIHLLIIITITTTTMNNIIITITITITIVINHTILSIRILSDFARQRVLGTPYPSNRCNRTPNS